MYLRMAEAATTATIEPPGLANESSLHSDSNATDMQPSTLTAGAVPTSSAQQSSRLASSRPRPRPQTELPAIPEVS
jgi:hypothetical protein